MGNQFKRERWHTKRIRKVKSTHREWNKTNPGKYLRMLMVGVRVGLGESACEAAGKEPLHYIPNRPVKLRVKATEMCGATDK